MSDSSLSHQKGCWVRKYPISLLHEMSVHVSLVNDGLYLLFVLRTSKKVSSSLFKNISVLACFEELLLLHDVSVLSMLVKKKTLDVSPIY